MVSSIITVLHLTPEVNQSKVYGDTDPIIAYQAVGFKGSDNANIISGALARTAGENASVYPINIGNLSPGDNYDISVIARNFSINNATLTVTANSAEVCKNTHYQTSH